LILIFIIKGLFAGNIKKTLMTVGAFLAIILVSYILSSGTDLDLTPFNSKGLGITEAISKNVGAGLIALYILMFLAVLSLIFSGFKKTSK
jgi:TRAP-type mannitol/chloroaromatic compound transport system permease large subunit